MASLKFGLTLLVFALTYPSPVVALPDRPAPSGMQSYDGPSGGRIIDCALKDASSGQSAFRAGVIRMRGYFDPSPRLISGVRSKNGNITIMVFSATLNREPVVGLAIATYDAAGDSRFGVVFDSSRTFSRSVKPLLSRMYAIDHQALAENRPAARPAASGSSINFAAYEAASRHVSLTKQEFPDGTVSIGIADGFRPVTMSAGSFVANADDGSYIKISVPVFPLDPRGSSYQTTRRAGPTALYYYGAPPYVEYDGDPITDWKNVLTYTAHSSNVPDPSPQVISSKKMSLGGGLSGRALTGTMTLKGTQYAFLGRLITSPPGPTGSWMLQITMLAAPINRVAQDMPALLAMFQSERVNMAEFNAVSSAQLKANLAAINAWGTSMRAQSTASHNEFEAEQDSRFQESMANMEASQDSIDRSTAGFIHIINGTSVVQDNTTGEHATMDSDLAGALEKSDPANYQPVPLQEYIKGVDYH